MQALNTYTGNTTRKSFLLGALFFIILFSFFNYSALYSPLFCSDDAVSILMLHYFSLPHDLYLWGQDRYGSLIPLLGQFFFKLFHLSAVSSESVTHYILLALGYLGFSSLFRSRFTKLLFAVIWFLPPFRFNELLRYNLGLQCALIGMAIYLVNRVEVTKSGIIKHALYIIIIVVLIAAVWNSDLALISAILLVSISGFYSFRTEPSFSKVFYKKAGVLYTVIGILAAAVFILYAKSTSTYVRAYSSFNNIEGVGKSVKIFASSFIDLFIFTGKEFFVSIYCWLLLLTALVLAIIKPRLSLDSKTKRWMYFFLLDAAFTFILIMLSKWSYLNGVNRRYFVTIYVSLWMSFLLAFDSYAGDKKILNAALFITVIIGAFSTVYIVKFFYGKALKSRIAMTAEFERLGNAGIIADYWSSYVNAVSAPDKVKATPYELSGAMRNRKYADEVLQQQNIYLINDNWLDAFPDTINQFGYSLVREGNEFSIGNSNVCRYRKDKVVY